MSPSCWRRASGDEGATWASHRSAAALYRLDGRVGEDIVEVSTTGRLDPLPGITLHRATELHAADLAHVDGIPAIALARTLLELGAVISVDEVELALEDALRRRLVTLPRLQWTLKRLGRRGRSGTATLRQLLNTRRHGFTPTASALEVRVARLIHMTRLPVPVRQAVVRVGKHVSRVDFAWPDIRLGVEADSFRFHTGRADWVRERRVQNALTLLGWTIIRVTWEDLERRADNTVEQIRAAHGFCSERAARAAAEADENA